MGSINRSEVEHVFAQVRAGLDELAQRDMISADLLKKFSGNVKSAHANFISKFNLDVRDSAQLSPEMVYDLVVNTVENTFQVCAQKILRHLDEHSTH